MQKFSRFFRIFSAALVIFTLVATLAPSSALAKGRVVKRKRPPTQVTTTVANTTVTSINLIVPTNKETCTPDDNIKTTGVPDDARVFYAFFVLENGSLVKIAEGWTTGNLNAPFPYPAITGTMTFSAAVKVFKGDTVIFKAQKKWTVTCTPPTETETPPPPTETETPPPPTETETPPPPTETETPPPPTETVTPPPPTETETPPPPTETVTPPPPTETVTPPPAGGEGCTPGYWRQDQHFDSWVGYYPSDDFAIVFSVAPTFDPHSLLNAVWLGGGDEDALARHAVAALLNASNPSVNYLYSVSDVIAMVQFAYATGNFETTKNLFEVQNESFCPLN
jgi:hypothetical protein